MLKLTKVEMTGFKSFCDRTQMHFTGEGIAAVVGPNGCGKSNLSDAINWVLGEQSARSLRGERMADVIFNGTRDRRPTGMAEVTLTLVDPEYHAEKAAGHDGNGFHGKHGEVVIGRRLFRSGESEYLLNGQPCRLRDIQEIFLGTGLGPNSYAIIEQGRIGQILSSKPYDRRALIEEAAGVTKFKTKRRLAEAKLDASKQNLARVNDILEEVTRQVNSLKRQASKARRYGRLREELRGRLRVVYLSRAADLSAQIASATAELQAAGEQLRGMSEEVDSREQEQFDLSRTGFEKEDLLRQRREIITGLTLEIERARNRLAYQEQQISEIEARLRESAAQAEQAAARLAALEAESAAGEGVVAAATAQLEAARAAATRLQEELLGAEALHREKQGALESTRAFLILMLGEVSEIKNQLAQVEEYAAGLARQLERAERELAAGREEDAQLRGRREELVARMAERQLELESVAQRKAAVSERLAELAAQTNEARKRQEWLRAEFAQARARRESLDQILAHRAYTAESVKQLFAAGERGGSFRPLGVLADYLEVDAPYEHQVEDFLKDELEYVVVQDWEGAGEGLRLLKTESEGRATFLVHPPRDAAPAWRGNGSLPPMDASKVLGCLLDHLRLSNGLAASAASLLPRLKHCYLVDSEDAGRRLAAAHPEYYFLAPGGECFHGYTVTGGKRTNAGPLALKRELREVAPRVEQLGRDLEACAAELQHLELETRHAEEAMEHLRTREVEQEKLAAGAEQEMKQLADFLHRTAERISVAGLEIQRLGHEQARAGEQGARLRGELEARAARRTDLEADIQRLTAEAAAAAALQTRQAQELSEARSQAAALEERRRAAVAALERLAQQLATERAAAGEFERQTSYGLSEIERLRADNGAAAARAVAAGEERSAAEQAAATMQADLEAGRARMAGLEEEIKNLRAALEEAREQKSAREVDRARLESDRRHLEETCQSEMGMSLTELATAHFAAPAASESAAENGDDNGEPLEAPAPEAPSPLSEEIILLEGDALAEAEEQVRQMRERLEAMGPVNMMALEEYQEAAQRFEFLDLQRQDLLDSIRDTQQAIMEMDTVSRRQFEQAFEAINHNFQDTFRTLFGGGSAMMRLTEVEGDAEPGIDLVVQPPGKRLQNVLLLSGGEKALTALGLLLAIFRYQPSPFCILDEVDAPLDDTNIGRFTEMVGKMSLRTQFIVITHSKKTMEAAPVLYGVTMDEPGVSRLVSVRFHDGKLAAIA